MSYPLIALGGNSSLAPCFTLSIITYRDERKSIATMDFGTEKQNDAFGVFNISIQPKQVDTSTPVTPMSLVMEKFDAAWDDQVLPGDVDYRDDVNGPIRTFELELVFSADTKLQERYFQQPDFWLDIDESYYELKALVELMLANQKPNTSYPREEPESFQTQSSPPQTQSSDTE